MGVYNSGYEFMNKELDEILPEILDLMEAGYSLDDIVLWLAFERYRDEIRRRMSVWLENKLEKLEAFVEGMRACLRDAIKDLESKYRE